MTERRCNTCLKKVKYPHLRVWEEDLYVSTMMTFCSVDCMLIYYKRRSEG